MANANPQKTAVPSVIVRVKASLCSGPYRLEWDLEQGRWNRLDEVGEPLGVEDLEHAI